MSIETNPLLTSSENQKYTQSNEDFITTHEQKIKDLAFHNKMIKQYKNHKIYMIAITIFGLIASLWAQSEGEKVSSYSLWFFCAAGATISLLYQHKQNTQEKLKRKTEREIKEIASRLV